MPDATFLLYFEKIYSKNRDKPRFFSSAQPYRDEKDVRKTQNYGIRQRKEIKGRYEKIIW